MEQPEGESWGRKALKGFLEREETRSGGWQILHQQGDNWQCRGIVPGPDGYGNGRPQLGLHARWCKFLFSFGNPFGHFRSAIMVMFICIEL